MNSAGFQAIRAFAARTLMAKPVVRAVDPVARRRLHHMGLQIVQDSSVISAYTRAEIFWGIYERPEISFIRRFLQGSEQVVELGAGIGVSSAHIASGMASGGRLICVEANGDFLQLIERNALGYAEGRNVEVIVRNAGIASHPEESWFYLDDNPFQSRITDHRVSKAASTRARTVAGCTLWSLVQEYELEDFDLVSDIEGGEATFILGDGCTGLERCRRIVIELHDGASSKDSNHEALLDTLRHRWGFSVLAQKGRVIALQR
jgi:FkbM family methyltransferase